VACGSIWEWSQGNGQWGCTDPTGPFCTSDSQLGNARAVAVGAESSTVWVVDNNGETWNPNGIAVGGNPNEFSQPYAHSIALFGDLDNVPFSITGEVAGAGNFQVCEWNGSWTCPVGGSWTQPTEGGWGKSVSASGNMVAVLNAQNEIWIDTGD